MQSLDDECKPNVGVQVATKMATDKNVIGGVTHYCSAVAMATIDVYHQFGMPAVVWGAVLPDITYANDFKEVQRVNGTMIGITTGARESLKKSPCRPNLGPLPFAQSAPRIPLSRG